MDTLTKTKESNPVEKNNNSHDTVSSSQIMPAIFESPFPSPHLLRQYDEVHPGLAARIVSMAEHEGDHRRNIEKLLVDQKIHFFKRRQRYGFAIAFIGLLAATGVGSIGHYWLASILGVGTLICLVFAFLGQNTSNKHQQ